MHFPIVLLENQKIELKQGGITLLKVIKRKRYYHLAQVAFGPKLETPELEVRAMNPFKVKVTASLAGVIFASSSLMVVGAKATQVGGVDTDFLSSEFGQATLVKGSVHKSLPADSSRSSYGDFSSLKMSEKLPEGTLVKTGAESLCEISWMVAGKTPAGKTRLWANSIATVSTRARLVHLQKGEIVHKKTKGTADQFIETKLLQARIHGTTVDVKVDFVGDTEVDNITILETDSKSGVEVTNRLNGSKVSLRPGIVLEIRGALKADASTPSANSSPNLCLKPDKGELIFQDSKSQMIAYVANSKAVLEHPLVRGKGELSEIDSIDLIRRDMAKVPSSDDVLGNIFEAAINIGKPDKLITKNLSIASVPTKTRYYVGPNVGHGMAIELPNNLAYSDFQPAGRIAEPERNHVASTAAISSQHHVTAPMPALHGLPLPDPKEPPKPMDPQELITADNLQIDAHHGKAN